MKKVVVIVIVIFIVTYISYNHTSTKIEENKIYTKNIDFSVGKGAPLDIDDTRIIEKSKEILTAIYNENDFTKFNIDINLSSDSIFYAYFLTKETTGYFISFNIDEGILNSLIKLEKVEVKSKDTQKSLEELLDIAEENIEKLQIYDIDSFEIDKYEFFGETFAIYYKNKYSSRQISIFIDYVTGELLEYNYYI